MFTSSTADAVPLPLEGKDKTLGKEGEIYKVGQSGLSQTSSTATRSPFSYKEKALTRGKVGACSILERLPIYVIWSLVSGLYMKKRPTREVKIPLSGAAIDY